MKSESKISKKQQNIISIIAFIIVVILIAGIIAIINFSNKNDSKSQTSSPSATPKATATASPAPSETAITSDTPGSTDAADTKSNDAAINNDTQSTATSNITDSTSLKTAQTQFDQYMNDKNYNAALDLLKNSFINTQVTEAKVNSYKNYVTYYESQGKYSESLAFQLNYIEKEDGLDNVVPESIHYKSLQNTLQHTSSNDERIQKIQNSTNRWQSIMDLIKQGSYSEVEAKLQQMKEEGLDCVTYYSYLGKVYYHDQKYKEQMELYFSFIDSHSNYNTLEKDFVTIFENTIAALRYQDMLTDEDIEPYEDRVRLIDQEQQQQQ